MTIRTSLFGASFLLLCTGCAPNSADPSVAIRVSLTPTAGDYVIITVVNRGLTDVCVSRNEIQLNDQIYTNGGALSEDPKRSLLGIDVSDGLFVIRPGTQTFGGEVMKGYRGKLVFHFANCSNLFSATPSPWKRTEVSIEPYRGG